MQRSISASAAVAWSLSPSSRLKRKLACRPWCSPQHNAAAAPRSSTTALPTPVSPALSTAPPGTTHTDTGPAAATERTCMPTRAACPTWLRQTPVAMPTSLGDIQPPPPTMSRATQRTQTRTLTQTGFSCTKMRWRVTTVSAPPTIHPQQRITAATCTLTTATMNSTAWRTTRTPRCDRPETARLPAATSRSARRFRRLWWQNIWEAGTSATPHTNRQLTTTSTSTTGAPSSAWATRPCTATAGTPPTLQVS